VRIVQIKEAIAAWASEGDFKINFLYRFEQSL